jgi:sugar phosphate isomerase/epimerase
MARLGIQLIVFGKRAGEDLPGVLRDVKAAGYDGAEIGNPAAQEGRSAADVKALFDDVGLACSGYHTGFNAFSDHDLLARTADHMNAVGARYLMCSGTAGRDRDGYLRSAETFNAAGALLQKRGVSLCYHNHNWEFFPLDNNEKGLYLLADNTDPTLVKLCVDVYWVACAGEDPAAFVRRYADRAVYFHYKDGTFDTQAQPPQTFTELGHGQVDLKAAHAAILAQNPDWIVTEQDKTERAPAESARISADYARRELGI